MKLISMIFGAIFTNNIILSKFLGICPFMGVSKNTKSAIGMGGAVLFVMLASSVLTYAVQYLILVPFEIEYMQLIAFILIIASFVQLTEMVVKKYSPSLYKSLGVYLPLITTNCAVLFVAQDNITQAYNLVETIVNALSVSVGFMFVLFIYSCIRERLESSDTLPSWKGNPVALIVAGIMALAFSGLAGIF